MGSSQHSLDRGLLADARTRHVSCQCQWTQWGDSDSSKFWIFAHRRIPEWKILLSSWDRRNITWRWAVLSWVKLLSRQPWNQVLGIKAPAAPHIAKHHSSLVSMQIKILRLSAMEWANIAQIYSSLASMQIKMLRLSAMERANSILHRSLLWPCDVDFNQLAARRLADNFCSSQVLKHPVSHSYGYHRVFEFLHSGLLLQASRALDSA